MSMWEPSLPHLDRTATQPRASRLEPVVLSLVSDVNDDIRICRLQSTDTTHTIAFRAGQWVDTYIPGVAQAGGFTITSTPKDADSRHHKVPFLELAIQRTDNPPAQWLWKTPTEILGTELAVRVGGSFSWPPSDVDTAMIRRLVLIAGGVGINPLIAILGHILGTGNHLHEIHLLYSTRAAEPLHPERILFLTRLMDMAKSQVGYGKVTVSLFLTSSHDNCHDYLDQLPKRTFNRRMTEHDLIGALDCDDDCAPGGQCDRRGVLCMVCGPPTMTDDVVDLLRAQPGMDQYRVLCEKWW